jgi:hypothetical protein
MQYPGECQQAHASRGARIERADRVHFAPPRAPSWGGTEAFGADGTHLEPAHKNTSVNSLAILRSFIFKNINLDLCDNRHSDAKRLADGDVVPLPRLQRAESSFSHPGRGVT